MDSNPQPSFRSSVVPLLFLNFGMFRNIVVDHFKLQFYCSLIKVMTLDCANQNLCESIWARHLHWVFFWGEKKVFQALFIWAFNHVSLAVYILSSIWKWSNSSDFSFFLFFFVLWFLLSCQRVFLNRYLKGEGRGGDQRFYHKGRWL